MEEDQEEMNVTNAAEAREKIQEIIEELQSKSYMHWIEIEFVTVIYILILQMNNLTWSTQKMIELTKKWRHWTKYLLSVSCQNKFKKFVNISNNLKPKQYYFRLSAGKWGGC